MSRIARLPVLLLALPLACAVGEDDVGLSSFGPSSVGPSAVDTGDGGDTGETDDPEADTDSGEVADGTTGGGEDDGNPLCCEVGAQAGCDSVVTEACVCTSEPACCQAVWSQECVDLAVACGDPYCEGGDASGDGGSSDGGEVMLDCDGDFSFSPQNPAPGVPFTATFTDPVGLTWVGMRAQGPGGSIVDGSGLEISGGGPFFWSYDFSGMAAGIWTFEFTHRESENGPDLVRASCEKLF